MFKIFKRRKIIIDIINEKLGGFLFKLFSFILVVFLARILTHEEFGMYNLLISLSIIISYFASFGIPIATIKYVSNPENDREKIFGFFLKLTLIFGGISLLLFTILSEKISEQILKDRELYIYIIFSAIISYVISIYNTLRSSFIAMKSFNIYRNVLILEGALKMIIIPLSMLFMLNGALLGFFLSYIIVTIISLLIIKKEYGWKLSLSYSFRRKGLYRYLAFLNLSTAARSIYAWIDSIIIAYLLDVKSLSYYRVAQSFIGALVSLTGLQTVFSPRFSIWSIDEIKRRLPLIFILNLIIVLPIVFVLNVFGKIVIIFIYGEKYINSYELLKPFSFLLILNSFSYFTTIFNMKGKSEYTSIVTISMSICNIIFDIILIKLYGLIGAVYATILAWIISLIVASIIFIKKF